MTVDENDKLMVLVHNWAREWAHGTIGDTLDCRKDILNWVQDKLELAYLRGVNVGIKLASQALDAAEREAKQ